MSAPKDSNQEDFKHVQSVLRQHASGRHPSDNLSLDHHEHEDGEQHHVETPAPEQVSVFPWQLWKVESRKMEVVVIIFQWCVCLMFVLASVCLSWFPLLKSMAHSFLCLDWFSNDFCTFFHPPGQQQTWGEILNKAGKRALGGGAAGAIAMFTQVGALMWMRTTMNYQYRNGGSTSKIS